MEVAERSPTIRTDSNSDIGRLQLVRDLLLSLYKEKTIAADVKMNEFIGEHGHNFGVYGNIAKEWYSCERCRLKDMRKKTAFASGSLFPLLSVIGEAPGPEEDEIGVPFCGPTGTLLRDSLSKAGSGIDVAQDAYFFNALSCIPKDTKFGGFRTPSEKEVRACLPRFSKIYNLVASNSKAILITGKVGFIAWQLMNDPTLSYEQLSKQRVKDILGWHTPNTLELDGKHPNVYVTYHPSYIMRQKTYSPDSYKEVLQQWIFDLAAVNKYITDGKLRNPRSK